MLKSPMTCRADSNQYLSQNPNEELAEGGESGRRAGCETPGELTTMLRNTSERADGKPALSDAEFVPQFSYNGSDAVCHEPEES